MTDQTNEQQTNGGTAKGEDSPEALKIKAEHRQAIAKIESDDRRAMAEMYRNMPVPLRVIFDPIMGDRVRAAAEIMSQAEGFTPRHLLGKRDACFVVVTKALTWKLDPQAVAASTYQTPDGKVGYEGKLVQAIIEGSGKLTRPIGQGEYFGDWSKVEGRFKIVRKTTQSGKSYDAAEPLWEFFGPDEEGLGVRYKIYLAGQEAPLPFEFKLRSAFPRNATTWPTRPQQQLHYAAMRALGNVVCPSLLMGVPSQDDVPIDPGEMRDITPPKAPPPVDLAAEGITGHGPMTEADEAAQRQGNGSSTPVETQAPAAQASQPSDDGRPSWEFRGQRYLQPGRVQSNLIANIQNCLHDDDLSQFTVGKIADMIATLPAANRQAVEHEIEHQRSVIDADRERQSSETPRGQQQADFNLIKD